MIIVFDMDNTLTDDFGSKARPGMTNLLEQLAEEDFELALWTHSTRDRALSILALHNLDQHFSQRLFREDYDPDGLGGKPKDIRRLGGHALIDDDPMQIDYMRRIGRYGFLVTPFRGDPPQDKDELQRLWRGLLTARRHHRRWGWTLPLRDTIWR